MNFIKSMFYNEFVKTWKGFKTYMSSKVGVDVDDKYKFF